MYKNVKKLHFLAKICKKITVNVIIVLRGGALC